MTSAVEFTNPDPVVSTEGGRILFKRAEHPVRVCEDEHGRRGLGYTPPAEQWASWTTRFETQSAYVAIVVLLGCPKCSGIIYLPHTPNAAKALAKFLGIPVRVKCSINPRGVIDSGVMCPHGCGFERKAGEIKLDEWTKIRRVYSAQIRRQGSLRLETVYTHAMDQKEALAHLALRPYEILEAGPAPAIGWLGDAETGKLFGG